MFDLELSDNDSNDNKGQSKEDTIEISSDEELQKIFGTTRKSLSKPKQKNYRMIRFNIKDMKFGKVLKIT